MIKASYFPLTTFSGVAKHLKMNTFPEITFPLFIFSDMIFFFFFFCTFI
jgi:hypothetical protein